MLIQSSKRQKVEVEVPEAKTNEASLTQGQVDMIKKKRVEAFSKRLQKRLKDEAWVEQLSGEFAKPYWGGLVNKLIEEKQLKRTVFPPEEFIFHAFNCCSLNDVKVVIIGQDPYHGPGQAMGLSFSVQHGVAVPPSLQNIYKELTSDITGFVAPRHGNLEKWAKQGVLMLNAVLTVRMKEPDSHAAFGLCLSLSFLTMPGWANFTDKAISVLNQYKSGIVFMLWGSKAQAKKQLVNASRHHVLQCAHPSPHSADKGFFGCKHFSKANEILSEQGLDPIDWTLENQPATASSLKRATRSWDSPTGSPSVNSK